jgi:hypothetical protein
MPATTALRSTGGGALQQGVPYPHSAAAEERDGTAFGVRPAVDAEHPGSPGVDPGLLPMASLRDAPPCVAYAGARATSPTSKR